MRRATSSLLFLHLLLTTTGGGVAAAPSTTPPALPARVDSRFLLHFADDREAILAGLQVPGCREDERSWEHWCAAALEIARAFLAAIDLRVEILGSDRWQRPLVVVRQLAGPDLQSLLLERGLALVDPLSGPEGRIAAWLEVERRARQQGLGIWRAEGGLMEPAEAVAPAPLRFRLVCGRVEGARALHSWIYLNFGPRRGQDFSLRLSREIARLLHRDGLDPVRLAGRAVCARGWIVEAGGGMMDIINALQLEVQP